MSERERWIVYPLLFLALGTALRDKIFNLTRSQTVVCESLAVFKNGNPDRPAAVLGGSGNDLINVDRIHTKYLAADQIIYGGRPLNPGGAAAAITPAQFLRMLQSMGLLREEPPKSAAEPAPPASGKTPPK